MKNRFHSLLLASACLLVSANAVAMTFCSAPLPPDCLDPKWGIISPDDPSASIESNTAVARASSHPVGQVRLMTVADAPAERMSKAPSKSVGPFLLIDDGRRFERETRALIGAIKRATFDRKGALVEGGDRIAKAIEDVREAAPNHVLTLYVNQRRRIMPEQARLLAAKVQSLDAIFKRGADYRGR